MKLHRNFGIYRGYIYALLASIFNGTVGIFSVKMMSKGLSPYAVSFYKYFTAFLLITSWSASMPANA